MWAGLLQGRSTHPCGAKGCGNGLTVPLRLGYRRLVVVERGWLEGMESGSVKVYSLRVWLGSGGGAVGDINIDPQRPHNVHSYQHWG